MTDFSRHILGSGPYQHPNPFARHQHSHFPKPPQHQLRLQQLKMNNPFERITTTTLPYTCNQQQKQRQTKSQRPLRDLENPFYRKYLIRDFVDEYIQYPPATSRVYCTPPDEYLKQSKSKDVGVAENRSLKFFPTESGRLDIQQTSKQIQGYGNRMGREYNYNSNQAPFDVEESGSKIFDQVSVSSARDKGNKIQDQKIMDIIQDESISLGGIHKDRRRIISDIVLDQRGSSDSPVNSLVDQKINDSMSYFNDVLRIEGRDYYSIPLGSKQERRF